MTDRVLSRPALAVVMAGASLVTVDISMTSTALPELSRALGVSPANAIWVVNAYYLAVIAALLPMAALGDNIGHRRLCLIGLALFGAGSAGAGLSDGFLAVVGSRAMIGLGAAAVNASTPALIRSLYPAHRLGRGLGLYAMIVGLSLSLGPPMTSFVIAIADWQWLFRVTAAGAVLAYLAGRRALPVTIPSGKRVDRIAVVLCAVTFALLLFALSGIGRIDIRWVALAGAGAMAFGIVLWRRDSRNPAPLLAMDLFRRPVFALSSATSICAFVVQGLVFVVLPFLFSVEMGYTQIEAGLLITPWPAALALMTLIAAPLSDRVAPGLLAFAGLLVLSVGVVGIATMPVDASIVGIAARLVICAIGYGLFQSPNMVAIMQSAPLDRSGAASGVLALSRLLGQAIGAVVVAVSFLLWSEAGMHTALWIAACVSVLGAAFSILRLLPRLRHPEG
ncbi:multidrug MFS transporter [Oceanicola sp. 22II-s10i]|uniref:MFS transporter n=1 Tax=Oceanicola sp. 22II-s10i TaxID=1317116 RepID=UPI000B5219B0|nr:MFS transporter [Oceanicola sp. 22II-s10i]OWU83044.1 multidrug MFS transporter [Oceanicola sp. 22II-s10i]